MAHSITKERYFCDDANEISKTNFCQVLTKFGLKKLTLSQFKSNLVQ